MDTSYFRPLLQKTSNSSILEQRSASSFGWFAAAWFGAFAVYLLALLLSGPTMAELLNNVAWTLAPLGAGAACRSTARIVELLPSQRRAWNTMAIACASWLLGQLIWDYSALAGPVDSELPNPSKLFYFAYAVLMVRALGGLSDSTAANHFTMEHLGNLGLIGCCLAVTIVVAFLEPVSQAQVHSPEIVTSLLHSTFVAATFFAALYYLWTRPWHATWGAMLLIVAAMGIYTMGNLVYVHALVTHTYRPANWVNATWLAMFLLIALAARLRAVASTQVASDADTVSLMARRSRFVEAMVPALLIVLMVAVGMAASTQLSVRVLLTTAALLLVFALILGAREAWIQGESQRLTLELRNTNERLRDANVELQDSEARVRDLNAHLEERVAQRTRQLQNAYEELEGFSYAVAHDLKAPLRSIDGFGHLLDESLRARADSQTSRYLQRIRRSAMKMSALIDDLLAYSRIERRTLVEQWLDLDQVIGAVVDECAREIQVGDADLAIDVPQMQVFADPEGVAVVMRNLLQNALKFTHASRRPRIEIRARALSSGVELVVRDNGIGFDMQYHDQIFGLFHRLHREGHYSGTGIGLALVRKALERMQGSVHAQSSEGEGATFVVNLPARVR